MGLFSSSYKYYAFAGSSALFEEDNRPHTVLQLMLNGILGNTASPPEAIITGLNTNLYARAKSMWKYAAKPDGYVFGFPTTNKTAYFITWDELEPYVEADVGEGVDVNSYYLGNPNDFQYFWVEEGLQDNYNSWFTGDPSPLTRWYHLATDVPIPVVNPDTGDYYTSTGYSTNVVGNDVTVTWNYVDKDGAAQTWVAPTYTMGWPGDTGETQYLMVRYRLTADTDYFDYWFYEIGSGANPALESQIQSLLLEAEYLPISILMHDRVWFDEAVDFPEWAETLDRLMRDIALDPYDIKEQYLDSLENPDPDTPPDSIPDIEDVWDFFVKFAVPLRTRDRGGREYLFHFYDHLRLQTWTTFDQYNTWVAAPFGDQPASNMSVEEGSEYTGYIARYAWSYIEKKTFEGDFTPPGWVEPLKKRRLWSATYQLGDADYNYGLDMIHGPGNYNVATSQPEGTEHSYTIVVRRNEDETHTAILMMGPSMEYQINTSETPVGVGDGGYVDYRYRFVDVELFPEDPEEDSEFRWPVHIGSLKEVSAMQRENSLSDGLCATLFLVERVKVKWYQKGFFKWLIVIIVVIIVILLWQYELLPTIAAAATAATGATALGLWALYVVLTFAIGFLVSFAGGLIGGRLGQLFVIVAMFMAMGGSFSNINPFSKVSSAWTNLTTTPSFGSAIQFIQATYPFLSTGQKIYVEYEMHKLKDEMEDFVLTAREKYEQLQDAWDSMGQGPSWVDPLEIARTFSMSGLFEDPASFYYRTLHANPGSLGYDLIENFTEMAVMLPKRPGSPGIVDSMMETFAEQRGQV